MKNRKIRKPYDESNPCQLFFEEQSRAKQSFKDECDINNIMKKYQKTGLISHVNKYGGFYDELPNEPDYQEALESITKARELFGSLPSEIRTRFGNDPASFLAFVENPANVDEMVRMGLITRSEPKLTGEPLKGPPDKKGTEGTDKEDKGAQQAETPDK